MRQSKYIETFLAKVRALPLYITIRIVERHARLRKLQQLRIRPLRDLAHPTITWNVEYLANEQASYSDTVGIYLVKEIYLHRPTGLCFIQNDITHWPIGIKESGIEEYQELSLRHQTYFTASNISHKNISNYSSSKPCFIFNVANRKTNYYHFLIDSLPRLIEFLEHVNEEIIVLHFCERSGFIGEYLDLVAEIYGCRYQILDGNGSRHIKISSPVYFMEDSFKRLSFSPAAAAETWQRLLLDPQIEMMNIKSNDIKARKINERTTVKSWGYKLVANSDLKGDQKYHSTYKGYQYVKNNSTALYYSTAAIDSLYQFGQKIINKRCLADSSSLGLCIVRNKMSSRNRYVSNEGEILSLSNIQAVDFAELTVEQQIITANGCKLLIGLTGAGLANLVFMEPGGLVVEITAIGYSIPATNTNEDLCKRRGIHYKRIFSTPLDRDGGTRVDIEQLAAITDSFYENRCIS